MRAIYFDGQRATIREQPDPHHNECTVKVSLAGICGTDLEILDGYMKYKGVLGHEFVGVVEGDSHLAGERVVGEINAGCHICDICKGGMARHCPHRTVLGIQNRDGAFADMLSLPEDNLHVIPHNITDEQAVFVEPLAAAFEITQQVSIKPDWKVAVVGDGRLAHLIVQVLRMHCDVTCFGRHPEKLKRLEQFDITTSTTIPDTTFDMTIEATGSPSGIQDALRLTRPRGIIILKSTTSQGSNADITDAIINEITLIGSRCGVFGPAITSLASGVISVNHMVDATYPLEEFDHAIQHARRPDTLKVFLKP